MLTPSSSGTFRLRDFDLDVAAYQLRRCGCPVKLERQPMDLLILLVENRGRLVSRSDIVARLWGSDVFVDVETSINIAISKVRQALRDSPEAPAFVETVVGKGYRFIGPVEVVPPSLGADTAAVEQDDPSARASAVASEKPLSVVDRSVAALRAPLVIGLLVVGLGLLAGLASRPWLGARSPAGVTVAVLPFQNLTGETDREYLADGLTEETVAALWQVDSERVSVIGRQSTMSYKRTTKSLSEIGRELGADYLVEGSVRAENASVRVTSKLIRVRDQVQVWSESYDREPRSILAMQRELSRAIAGQIRFRISPRGEAAIARRQPQKPDAYDLYLRGRFYANQRTPAMVSRAMEYYQQATAVDPAYALAWSGIADAYTSRPVNSGASPAEVQRQAREAAAQAMRADPDLAEVQTSLGRVSFWLDWDWLAAEDAFRRAIALDPGYAQAHRMLAHVLSQTGQHNQAQAAVSRARSLEPLNAMNHAISAQVAFQARDYAAAVEHARHAVSLDAEFWIGYVQQGQAYEQLGQTVLAFEAVTKATRFSGTSATTALRGYLLAKLGRASDARDVLRTLELVSRDRYVPPTAIAMVHAALGEREAVFEWLDRAYAARDVLLVFLPVDPKWDPYRRDSRFEALLARCDFRRSAMPVAPIR